MLWLVVERPGKGVLRRVRQRPIMSIALCLLMEGRGKKNPNLN